MSRETLSKTGLEGNTSSSPHLCIRVSPCFFFFFPPPVPQGAEPSAASTGTTSPPATAGGLLASMQPPVWACAGLGHNHKGLVTVLGRVTPMHAIMPSAKARQ